MCDLNNLKDFNDQHGHDAGDKYIILTSQVLKQVFGKYGKLYRIGGDEFCGILDNLTEEEYEGLEKVFDEKMAALSMDHVDIKCEAATGYAVFDSAVDGAFTDTVKRADALMYQNKIDQKGEEGLIR